MNLKLKHTLRTETPGCERVKYFDNAGAALLTSSVANCLKQAIDTELHVGGYRFQETNARRFQDLRCKIARLIGAENSEIALVDSASRAWSLVLNAIPFQPNDEILTSQYEYGANIATFNAIANRFGVKIKIVNFDNDGQLDEAEFRTKINANTRLLALTLCPSANGLVLDVRRIGQIAQNQGILFLLDACQAVGQMPVDVRHLACDFLTATGRKFLRAPRGTGFLYLKQAALERLAVAVSDHSSGEWHNGEFLFIRSAQQFELWEKSSVNTLGLLQAIENLENIGIENVCSEIQHLAQYARQQLGDLDFIKLHDRGSRQSGIVTFSVNTCDDHAPIKAYLRDRGVEVGLSNFAAAPWFMAEFSLRNVLRVSPHVYNTAEELDALVSLLIDYKKDFKIKSEY